MRIACILILFLFFMRHAGAQENNFFKKIRPDYIQLQFAGNIGLMSAGLGYNMAKDKLHIGIMDGFVPASLAGNNVNTLALKSSYDIYSFRLSEKLALKPYAGIALLFETSGNSFYLKLPERYTDRKYYGFSAFHMAAFAGGKLQMPVGKREGRRLELYAETGAIDSYVYYYFSNDELQFSELFSGALGLSYHFGN